MSSINPSNQNNKPPVSSTPGDSQSIAAASTAKSNQSQAQTLTIVSTVDGQKVNLSWPNDFPAFDLPNVNLADPDSLKLAEKLVADLQNPEFADRPLTKEEHAFIQGGLKALRLATDPTYSTNEMMARIDKMNFPAANRSTLASGVVDAFDAFKEVMKLWGLMKRLRNSNRLKEIEALKTIFAEQVSRMREKAQETFRAGMASAVMQMAGAVISMGGQAQQLGKINKSLKMQRSVLSETLSSMGVRPEFKRGFVGQKLFNLENRMRKEVGLQERKDFPIKEKVKMDIDDRLFQNPRYGEVRSELDRARINRDNEMLNHVDSGRARKIKQARAERVQAVTAKETNIESLRNQRKFALKSNNSSEVKRLDKRIRHEEEHLQHLKSQNDTHRMLGEDDLKTDQKGVINTFDEADDRLTKLYEARDIVEDGNPLTMGLKKSDGTTDIANKAELDAEIKIAQKDYDRYCKAKNSMPLEINGQKVDLDTYAQQKQLQKVEMKLNNEKVTVAMERMGGAPSDAQVQTYIKDNPEVINNDPRVQKVQKEHEQLSGVTTEFDKKKLEARGEMRQVMSRYVSELSQYASTKAQLYAGVQQLFASMGQIMASSLNLNAEEIQAEITELENTTRILQRNMELADEDLRNTTQAMSEFAGKVSELIRTLVEIGRSVA